MFYPKIFTLQINNDAPHPSFMYPGYNWLAAIDLSIIPTSQLLLSSLPTLAFDVGFLFLILALNGNS